MIFKYSILFTSILIICGIQSAKSQVEVISQQEIKTLNQSKYGRQTKGIPRSDIF